MMVRRTTDDDIVQITEWLRLRGSPVPKIGFPPFGMIVDGVACGFLIFCDCDLAMVDFFISNPNASNEDKEIAYDLLYVAVENEAIRRGVKQIAGYSKVPKVLALSIRHGLRFDDGPYFFMTKFLPVEANNGR